MIIEELKGDTCGEEKRKGLGVVVATKINDCERSEFKLGTKRVLVGVGARVLFYPTLLYNVFRNKIQAEFRWWDWIDEFVLLGAVPFPSDVPQLEALGCRGVITLNEPYETLVQTSLYHAYGINHLVIPTRDYCFAPCLDDISKAVEFIHENASSGQATYVHCKAGRGRSTTIVLCYLVQYKHMTPHAAYDYVKSVRPRVLLASAQWQAVQEFYHRKVKSSNVRTNMRSFISTNPLQLPSKELVAFDDESAVVVTKADLDGYNPCLEWADLSVIYRVRFAGQGALARISCLWLGCRSQKTVLGEELGNRTYSISGRGITVNINVY